MVFNKKGFTIVELMIAIAIFAIVSMMVTFAVVFIGRQYKQASTRVNLESAARDVHQQVSESIQFAGGDALSPASNGSGYQVKCIGDKQYAYGGANGTSYSSATYTSTKAGLYVLDIPTGTCPNVGGSPAGKNALPDGAKVLKFDYNSGTSTLSTVFASADADLLNLSSSPQADAVLCSTAVTGKEYCAVVKLQSTASRRVTN